MGEYLAQRVNELVTSYRGQWDTFDHDARVDWHLLWKWVRRRVEDLRSELDTLDGLSPLLEWTNPLVELCEKRQRVARIQGKDAAQVLSDAPKAMVSLQDRVARGELESKVTRFQAYKAANAIEEMRTHVEEWYGFYADYDPWVTWWAKAPWTELQSSFEPLVSAMRQHLVGISEGDTDAIVGQPSGRESILADLDREMIAYDPDEIIAIGNTEYTWCEEEMIKASQELGYGKDWRKALDHVKSLHFDPGEQTYMVHELAEEAVAYVTERDMITIPKICNETWRTFMMAPEKQKVNPFFLGGPYIQVSYPTSGMAHDDKLMIMRGNSRPLSRSTVFHELIPGHHLQFYYMDRYNTHRKNFMTPFWTEGWAFYWEMILWDRGFPDTAENRIGMLFWRMHRCTRIVFSLKFHLGEWTPQQCIDYLVNKGGHERATAEGEVRRSFNGEYSPLYQAGYMLGALQFYALRKELVETGEMCEKEFHDRILKLNQMPVELVRAMLRHEKLAWDHKASWKFYSGSHRA